MSISGARPPLHTLVYGDPGSRKSTFAATFPKPMNVFFFDPIGKETPYLRQGNPTEIYVNDQYGIYSRDVLNDAGELLIRIEYFGDVNIKKPTGYKAFLMRMQDFYNELDQWATAVVDSVTFMEFSARKYEQYVLNPKAKDQRQWWGGSTNTVEEFLQGSFGAMPINVIVTTHVTADKDEFNGRMVYRPNAPGRLKSEQGLPAGYSEVYHAYVGRDETGKKIWLLQTELDEMFLAGSQIQAPDPSWPDYEALWK